VTIAGRDTTRTRWARPRASSARLARPPTTRQRHAPDAPPTRFSGPPGARATATQAMAVRAIRPAWPVLQENTSGRLAWTGRTDVCIARSVRSVPRGNTRTKAQRRRAWIALKTCTPAHPAPRPVSRATRTLHRTHYHKPRTPRETLACVAGGTRALWLTAWECVSSALPTRSNQAQEMRRAQGVDTLPCRQQAARPWTHVSVALATGRGLEAKSHSV